MRGVVAVVLGVWLAISLAEAAGKKDKEIPAQICKRGKLIFEDDFSGKELLWNFDSNKCEWKIVKGALATKSTGQKVAISVRRDFMPVQDAVAELRILMPIECQVELQVGNGSLVPSPQFQSCGETTGTFSLNTWTQETGYTLHAKSPFPYRKPGWINVLFEAMGSRYALTVNGQTITCDFPRGEGVRLSAIWILPFKKESQVVAIDDVKVWEALPKDEEPEKDKKDKKKR